MQHKRKINKPYDFSFGILYNEYPKELHENLKIPGIFKRKSNVKVRLKDGKIREMDASYIVDPDFKTLFEKAVVNLEHQTKPVDLHKIQVIGDYNIQQTADERLPTLNIIATNIPEKYSVKEFERTPTNTTKLMILNQSLENNEKKLNKLKSIIHNNENDFTINDAVNLGIVAIFAPHNCEILKSVVEIYSKIKNKSKKLEYVLYSVLGAMIDAHSSNEKEFKDLMNMLNYETDEEVVDKFETEIISQNKIAELEEELKKAKEITNTKVNEANERVNESELKIKELKSRIKELEKQLNEK